MFTAYFDESEAATVYFVGGWVARPEVWAKFTTDWKAVLAASHSINYFRHNEAKGLKGEFAKWSESDVAHKIDDLASVICDHEMHGVIAGVRTTTWNKAFASNVLSKKQVTSVLKFTHPYQACFHAAVAAVFQRQLEKGFSSDVVDFVFDEQKGLLKDSIKVFKEFEAHFAGDVQAIAGDIKIGDDKESAPLQAADLLCGQIATSLTRGTPDAAYQRLVKCHEVAQTKAYPSKFEQTPEMVKTLDVLWAEKKALEDLISEEESKSGDER